MKVKRGESNLSRDGVTGTFSMTAGGVASEREGDDGVGMPMGHTTGWPAEAAWRAEASDVCFWSWSTVNWRV